MADIFVYVCVLKACTINGSMFVAMSIHSEVLKRGIEVDVDIGNSLINLYVKCIRLEEASKVFEGMCIRDSVSWGTLIEGFSSQGKGFHALNLFEALQNEGICPNKVIILFVMKACSAEGLLQQGMILHDQVVRASLELDLALGTALVEFYSVCGKARDARRVFESLHNKDAAAWGAMIGSYVQLGQGMHALSLFGKLQMESVKPTEATFSSTLKACGMVGLLSTGMLVHHEIVEKGLHFNGVIASALVDMYAKCGNFIEAQDVFDTSCNQDLISWGAIIARYATQGHCLRVLELFSKMHMEDVKPVKTIFLCVLKVCSILADLSWGSSIHSEIVESGLENDPLVGNALINLYAKTGALEDAHVLFNDLPIKDCVSWNTMMAGYTLHGLDLSALRFAETMHTSGVEQSKATYSNICKVCGNIGAIFQGKLIHDRIIKDSLECNVVVGSALVDMYTKCGCMADAQKVFGELPEKDIISWGSMTSGYALHGDFIMAKRCFLNMQSQGMHLSNTVFTSVLVAFTHAGLLEEGCELFSLASESCCDFLNAEHYSCMVDLLGRSGQLESAGDFSLSMPLRPSLPACRSFLTSCRTHGNTGRGSHCFGQMVEREGSNSAFG
jgi:pentatricopeptide repeat protein